MYHFLIKANTIFNKLFLICLFIFIGFCLPGCSPRIDSNDLTLNLNPSLARQEYETLQVFKQNNAEFYKQLKN